YAGDVLLIVNVASRCGFTPQYEPLQRVHDRYRAQGFRVLAFPCNQFGAQEPGANDEIRRFCTVNYKVGFDLFDKIEVNGAGAAPLYRVLTSGANGTLGGAIKWNFTKFLVGRDGIVKARIGPPTPPDAPQVVAMIEEELAAGR
ncbi:MAG: glutathione peroxidase, partial [Candidatus Hydrogenedentes bacterium]|nr:glutathione peroxidase [Candidatus Hydrogenedentota bacterium]